ncbi:hypothetical protein [Calothrix sp. NIES-3974]|uniref:hypothetical protein n=1 Tax=Calothrix sp. NIES-3974 TaxID=2005462 RepID=UPI0012FE4D29|nr:hypothetical protein [Calothrix sp. NIES-3974]
MEPTYNTLAASVLAHKQQTLIRATLSNSSEKQKSPLQQAFSPPANIRKFAAII